jgi:hypothetical protein
MIALYSTPMCSTSHNQSWLRYSWIEDSFQASR